MRSSSSPLSRPASRPRSAVTALLGRDAGRLSDDELDRIETLLKSAREDK